MKTTLNQLKAELLELKNASTILNSFFWGEFLRAVKERKQSYPLMCCYTTGLPEVRNNMTFINLVIVIADKVHKDRVDLDDTQSDAAQVVTDLVRIMQSSRRWQKIGRIESATAEQFIDRSADEVTGYAAQIRIGLFDNSGVCGLPFVGYDYERALHEDFIQVQTANGFLFFKSGENIDLSNYGLIS